MHRMHQVFGGTHVFGVFRSDEPELGREFDLKPVA